MDVKTSKPGRPLLELERFLPYRLNVVAESVSRALSRPPALGIGVPEWRVMATLGEYERMTAKQVGAQPHAPRPGEPGRRRPRTRG
jgi:hypothetical protein